MSEQAYPIMATIDSIGEGWTDPKATADRWNSHIAPVLAEYQESHSYDAVASASDFAWGEFCGSQAGESDEASKAMAGSLRAKYLDEAITLPVYLDNSTPTSDTVTLSSITSSGNAEPTSRVLAGSSDHGYDQEWIEPATLADGRKCSLVYLLNDEDFEDENGKAYDDLSNVDWAAHLVRVRLED